MLHIRSDYNILWQNKTMNTATHIFQPVQVFVSFAASFTIEGLFFFHSQGSGVGGTCFGIYDGECAVAILV